MTEHVAIHDALGISEERMREITKDVTTAIASGKNPAEGITKLSEKYAPEAMLAGIILLQVIAMQETIRKHSGKQNANLN